MNIKEFIYVELGGFCVLVDDLESIMGWDEKDFEKAYVQFVVGFLSGEHDPLKNLFLDESVEQGLKIKLYKAFLLISKTKLIEWTLS